LSAYYYLAGRLTSFVLALTGARLMYVIARRTGASPRLALVAPVLFATSTTIQSADGSVRNDMLPCVLMLACVAIVILWSRARGRAFIGAAMALAGLLAALAVSSKLTYVFLPAGTLLYLLAAGSLSHRRTAVAAFVIGVLAGTSVDVYYLAIAREQMLFH